MDNIKNTLIRYTILFSISLAIFSVHPSFARLTENNQDYTILSSNSTSNNSLNSFIYLIIFSSLIGCVIVAYRGRKLHALAGFFLFIISIIIWIRSSDIVGTLLFWIMGIVVLISSRKKKSPVWKRQKGIRRPFPKEVRDTILERQKNKCANCNTKIYPPLLHFDHINSNRTDNRISNCQALCPNCHVLKTDEDRRNQ